MPPHGILRHLQQCRNLSVPVGISHQAHSLNQSSTVPNSGRTSNKLNHFSAAVTQDEVLAVTSQPAAATGYEAYAISCAATTTAEPSATKPVGYLSTIGYANHLTWTALKSAGAKQSKDKNLNHVEESQQSEKDSKEKEKVSERYKDRLENLTIVSTLIVTASVASCLAIPGEADGAVHNLKHAMFQFFIIFITISLFSSISATIILFWATLGLTELVTFTLKIVMPLLGIALQSGPQSD
ncbi:hypothetical protein KIW84_010135 [Lathyrus oleraceus]|uniref:PGG domain-containing protein n=1 Tax=Pisum sativum TaxID=3888 RepID=A0A9D4YKE4_PEA|nr:hypothetical protein KIW84_010135 [Pisum sativum]